MATRRKQAAAAHRAETYTHSCVVPGCASEGRNKARGALPRLAPRPARKGQDGGALVAGRGGLPLRRARPRRGDHHVALRAEPLRRDRDSRDHGGARGAPRHTDQDRHGGEAVSAWSDGRLTKRAFGRSGRDEWRMRGLRDARSLRVRRRGSRSHHHRSPAHQARFDSWPAGPCVVDLSRIASVQASAT